MTKTFFFKQGASHVTFGIKIQNLGITSLGKKLPRKSSSKREEMRTLTSRKVFQGTISEVLFGGKFFRGNFL
jgi:hypothetical protein